MAKTYNWIVFSSPAPGRESEFNRWYTEQHLPDVLAVPGIVAAQRFALADRQMIRGSKAQPPTVGGKDEADAPGQYAALYEIESDDLAQVFETVMARIGTAEMPSSDAMGPSMASWCFMPITPRLTAE